MSISVQVSRYDIGRQKIYKAERLARKKLKKQFIRFRSIEDCQRFCDMVTSSQIWQDLNAPSPIQIKAMRRIGRKRLFVRRRSLGLAKFKKERDTGLIVFSHISLAPREILKAISGGWDNFTILHELAHAANPYQEKHGQKFVSAHLKLIGFHLGQEAENIFRQAYQRSGVNLPNI